MVIFKPRLNRGQSKPININYGESSNELVGKVCSHGLAPLFLLADVGEVAVRPQTLPGGRPIAEVV